MSFFCVVFCFFSSVPAIWRLHLFKHACQIDSLISVCVSSQCRISCSRPTSPSRYNNHGTKVRGWAGRLFSLANDEKRPRLDVKATVVLLLCNRGTAAGNSAASSCSLPTRVDIPCDCQTPRARAPQIVFFFVVAVVVCVFSRFIRASNDISNNMLP